MSLKTYVTKSYLPPINEFVQMLETIWGSNIVSNRGELVLKFERRLRELTNCKNVLALSNATMGLQFLIRSLEGKGSIITTPYSYVATTSSIVWENFNPVFVDIKKNSFQIDFDILQEKLKIGAKAILLTHVYGIPENILELEKIALQFEVPLFFDGAQAFGVKYDGNSIFNYGDASVCSFHATKIVHCGEGGAVFTKDKILYDKIYKFHNFGHAGFEAIDELGINGKMSELNAAMGLAVLPYLDQLIERRKNVFYLYENALSSKVMTLNIPKNVDWNYSYFPLVFESEEIVLKIQSHFNRIDIFPRRYFYPSLSSLDYITYEKMPNSEELARRVLCLPIHQDLTEDQILSIIQVVKEYL